MIYARRRKRPMRLERFIIVPMVFAGLALAGFAAWETVMRGWGG